MRYKIEYPSKDSGVIRDILRFSVSSPKPTARVFRLHDPLRRLSISETKRCGCANRVFKAIEMISGQCTL